MSSPKTFMTTIGTFHRLLILVALSSLSMSLVWAQANAPGQPSGAPPAASGPAAQNPDNPPLSGLDMPTTESPFSGRSYFIPGLQVGEAVDTNTSGSSGNHNTSTITRGLGSIDLQKIWRRYQVGLDYVAGGSYYTGTNSSGAPRGYQTHSFGYDQRVLWRTGQLSFRDTFTYLPEGTFGFGSYGGFGGFSSAMAGSGLSGTGMSSGLGGGIAGGMPGGIFSGGQFGSIGIQPRVDNLSIIDVVQGISPRSTVTLGAGYDLSEFIDKARSPFTLINSQMTTGQIGYDHLLNPKDQVALVAAYQQLQFPGAGGGGVHAYVFQARYGRRLSGRLDLVIAGGPQVTRVNTQFVNVLGKIIAIPGSTSIAGNGSIDLGYTLSARTAIHLDYQHYLTPGSGFYAGANTDAARVNMSHIVNRNWTIMTDIGYSYSTPLTSRSTILGINSSSYQYWYAGGTVRRMLGPHFDAFGTYQYALFAAGSCTSSTGSHAVCGQSVNRHTAMFGLDWHPRPIRLD
ncbi:MAG: hypothetical protein JO356_15470 [Acidobacteria bacterium]|nr:hypothetical protein [Acidobacteriota bacterium]